MIEWEMIVALVAIVMGSLILIIPLGALALRFAAKPLIEAFAQYRGMQGGLTSQQAQLLRDRVELLEQRLDGLEQGMDRLKEGRAFDARLGAGSPEPEAGGRPSEAP
ncbi:MAG TPA: hypothetical protein VMK65_02375 [Longimicrobiales bacterium]|nr:hypothetical protein [Longimicrobiales bacterium]